MVCWYSQSIDQSPAASVHRIWKYWVSQEDLENQWAENFYLRARRNAFTA